jgi:hypothetical protein
LQTNVHIISTSFAVEVTKGSAGSIGAIIIQAVETFAVVTSYKVYGAGVDIMLNELSLCFSREYSIEM